MSLLDELNPTCPRGCGRTMDDCHESEDGGECEGGELLRENERLKAQLAEAMRHLDEAQHKWQTLEQELADAKRRECTALCTDVEHERDQLNIALAEAKRQRDMAERELFDANTKLAEINAAVVELAPAPNSQSLEKVGATWELPSRAVVSEAVAHAEESNEDLGDSDTIKLPSLAKVVKTGTTVWEPLRSAEVAVLDKAKELASHVKEYAPALLGTGLHPVRHLIAAVDALVAAESTADGPSEAEFREGIEQTALLQPDGTYEPAEPFTGPAMCGGCNILPIGHEGECYQ